MATIAVTVVTKKNLMATIADNAVLVLLQTARLHKRTL
jgi:hypothetical protein